MEAAHLFVEQAKAAGVDVKVRKVDTGTFYGDDYLSWTFAQDFWNTRNYLPQVVGTFLPERATYNETHWDGPGVPRPGRPGSAQELDEAKRTELLHEAQEIEYDEGGLIIWGFSNQVEATTTSRASSRGTSRSGPTSSTRASSVPHDRQMRRRLCRIRWKEVHLRGAIGAPAGLVAAPPARAGAC